MTEGRYNIGLVVGNVEDDFSNSICKGAIQAAEEMNDNLFILPVKYIDYCLKEDSLQRYEYQYNTLLSYAQVKSLDIVLLCLSTIGSTTTRERCLEILSSFKDIPLILIATNEEGYSCVRYNNASGLADGVRYLIETEHRKHIGMVTGFLDNSDSYERLSTYKQVLAEQGLPIEDSAIKFAPPTANCREAVEELLRDNPSLDAIVCCNDSMATTVYKVLSEHHITIGEQISVLGFDDIEVAKHLSPPLATIRADASELGFRAVLQGHRKLLDHTVGKAETFFVDTKFVCRESIGACSSEKINFQKQIDEQDRLFEKAQMSGSNRRLIDMNHNMNILSRNMLTLDDNGEQNYTQIINCLTIADLESCFLFMLKTPTAYHFGDTWIQPDSLYLRAYLENGKAVAPRRTEQLMSVHDIYRHKFMPDTRKTYVMIDLYSRELQYGFMLCDISFNNFHYVEFLCYQISIAIKLMNMFDIRRSLLAEKDELVLRLQKENIQLDAISGKDELTGILNRRGFYKKANDFIEQAEASGGQIVFAYADLNYLKQINDIYGHMEGDFALRSCAAALEDTFPNSIVGRIGGDEFAVLAIYDTRLYKDDIMTALNRHLARVASSNKKPYSITISVGIWSPDAGKSFQLEEAVERADALLYEEKKKKPPFRKG
ncbi:MAG: GGDEF domain-containing protein [Lachnospiraceae bacterium]